MSKILRTIKYASIIQHMMNSFIHPNFNSCIFDPFELFLSLLSLHNTVRYYKCQNQSIENQHLCFHLINQHLFSTTHYYYNGHRRNSTRKELFIWISYQHGHWIRKHFKNAIEWCWCTMTFIKLLNSFFLAKYSKIGD